MSIMIPWKLGLLDFTELRTSNSSEVSLVMSFKLKYKQVGAKKLQNNFPERGNKCYDIVC